MINRNLKIAILMTIFSLFLITPVLASDENNDNLVFPFLNLENATEEMIDDYLIKMGFEKKEIEVMSTQLKADIAKKGGKKVELSKTSSEVVTYDQFGRKMDYNSSLSSTPSVFNSSSSSSSDIFSLWAYVSKNEDESNSSENSYSVWVYYKWSESPFNFYTDKLAVAWQSKAGPYGDPSGFGNTQLVLDCCEHPPESWDLPVDKQELEGTSWKVDVKAGGPDVEQWGQGYMEIRVPTKYEGTTGALEVGYAHRLGPGSITVTLNYGDVSFTPVLTEVYEDRYNFTY
ncbi:hypothetical protein [Longirhabdus pacifica]|uniref:hypothetical protein n=1 Tax=Longirhabdus pacifica TaxID=2305227 RepID=UPI001008C2E8|nr:hypothetical protein [Longirhabdus pacifica]